HGTVLWRGAARLQVAGAATGPWFPWAAAGLQALAALAAQIGLRTGNRHCGGRCFIELRTSADGKPQQAAGELASGP
ncbi:MAG: hypothetical protein ACRDXB_07825, partial [Actinomycetes bacterium]